MFGNRGIYYKGWSAVTKHRTPWVLVGGTVPAFDDDVWELYDGAAGDFSQARDLAGEQPERLHSLQRLWLIEAVKYNVLPLDDRAGERLIPAVAGRPTLIQGDSQLLFPGMGRLTESSVVNVKNRSFSLTAEVTVTSTAAEGVIIAQGGRFGGWSLYVKDGRPAYTYNHVGLNQYTVNSTERLAPGKATITLDFAYDGGRGKGGTATLSINGKKVGSGRIEATNANIFSADDAADVGIDEGTNVSSAYGQHGNKFTGKIVKVRVDTR
jgi:arylsulfatase